MIDPRLCTWLALVVALLLPGAASSDVGPPPLIASKDAAYKKIDRMVQQLRYGEHVAVKVMFRDVARVHLEVPRKFADQARATGLQASAARRNLAVGIALSASLAAAGIWIARRNRRIWGWALTALGVSLMVLAVGWLVVERDKIEVTLLDDGNAVSLTIPLSLRSREWGDTHTIENWPPPRPSRQRFRDEKNGKY